MKPTLALEPGVLSTFRLFIGVQVTIAALGVLTHWQAAFRPQTAVIVLSVFSILELGLLFVYLSIPGLQRILKSWYLPIGIGWATAGPILDPYIHLPFAGNNSPELFAQVVLWRQIILLFIPLIVVGWQYTMRQVVLFCVLTTVLNLALLFPTLLAQDIFSRSLLGIVFIQLIIFLLVGHMIANLMKVQREQRQCLTGANERLAHYAATLEQLTVSRERNRLARELHDVLAHTLSGVAVELEGTRALLPVDSQRATALLNHALQAIREGLTETRRALQELRAKPLEELGLALAVRGLAESYADRYALRIDLDIDPNVDDYPVEVQQCVYRIAQQALTNIVEHAQAQTAKLVLQRDQDQLRLLICDDGCGFDSSTHSAEHHYGLLGMRERSAMVGGHLQVEGQVGKGTKVAFCYGGSQ